MLSNKAMQTDERRSGDHGSAAKTLGRQRIVTVNRRVVQRLLAEIERFDLGEVSLLDLQVAILGLGLAAELGQQWQDLVNHVEGAIELARFTVPLAGQLAAIRPHLDRLRAAALQAMDAEPDDSE